MFKNAYWLFAHLGMMSLTASFLIGFRHDSAAPIANLWFNAALYAVFIAVHIVMTMPSVKRALFGKPEGTPTERRIYVTTSILTWVAVFVLHRPLPGPAFASPPWVEFIGYCAVLLSVVAFFEFATFDVLGSLLGMPGAKLSHSVGSETPLMTEGPYASVRHPMYRAALFLTMSSLLIHPNAAQLFFALVVSASFIGFIPFEERQLVRARGEEYRNYQVHTPYRVLQGVW